MTATRLPIARARRRKDFERVVMVLPRGASVAVRGLIARLYLSLQCPKIPFQRRSLGQPCKLS